MSRCQKCKYDFNLCEMCRNYTCEGSVGCWCKLDLTPKVDEETFEEECDSFKEYEFDVKYDSKDEYEYQDRLMTVEKDGYGD